MSDNYTATSLAKIKHKSILARYPALALLPLLLFVMSFLGTGIILTLQGMEQPFYQISPTVLIIPAVILSVSLARGSANAAIQHFLKGAGHLNVMTMCFIYLLAGAFGQLAAAIGGVESTVNLALTFIPNAWILPGILLTAAFISLSMGSALGTIAAMAPIALGIANAASIPTPIIMGTLVGGSMFGDNLSMISDTTIAAAQTQSCNLRDKFRMNAAIAVPAVVITLLGLYSLGYQGNVQEVGDYQLIKVVPYLSVFALALCGIDVMIVLIVGLLIAGSVGFLYVEGFTTLVLTKNIFEGFSSMREIFFLSMMVGGLGALMKQQGGITYLISLIARITKKLSGKEKSTIAGELGICTLVSLADICTAINTVAILISGDAAKQIAAKNNISSARAASLLDIFACVFQGILPYSAQILLAGTIAGLSPLAIVANVHYCFVLGVITLLAILFRYPRGRKG